MSLRKLTSLGLTLTGRNMFSPGVKSNVLPIRQSSKLLAVAPREKVSNTELVMLSVILSGSILFIPAWVIFHMNEYTKTAREAS